MELKTQSLSAALQLQEERERYIECVFSCTKGQSVHSIYESLVQTVLEEHSVRTMAVVSIGVSNL